MRKPPIALLLIIIFYVGIKFLFSGFIPFWDGGIYYYTCLWPAVTNPFNLANFNCFGHPSFVYMFFIGIFQFFSPGNTFLLHLPITLLGALSIVVFYKILTHLFPERTVNVERILATAIFAFHPVLIATSLHFNLDYGTFILYLVVLLLFLQKRLTAALITGTLLLFTKEPAVPIYGATVVSYWLAHYKKKILDRKILILMSPILLFAIYMAYTRIFLKASPLWAGFGMKRAAEILFIPSLTDPLFIQYLQGIFLFNFNWIFSGFIIVALGIALKTKGKKILTNKPLLFLSLTFILNTYILTAFKTFINLRYYLPLYAYLILFFLVAVVYLIKNEAVRRLILTTTLAITLVANVISIDPLTRFLFGTFSFGNHPMYKVTALPDGIHFGVDGLVYNLQFTAHHFLVEKMYADLKPSKNTTFVFYDDVGDWNFTGRVDNKTHTKTLSGKNSFKPVSYTAKLVLKLKDKPSQVYFVVVPTIKGAFKNTNLSEFYSLKSTKKYEWMGYSLLVQELRLR